MYAQRRTCGTMHVLDKHLQNNPNLQLKLDDIASQTAAFTANYNPKKSRGIVVIPVVVHILHNGEAVGVGANISTAQILSQITALNEDFRKINTDSLPTNHPFYSATADCEIQFCLASLKPDNMPTSGIERINIGVNSISDDQMDNQVKPQTIWNSTKYLNIWVCNITSSDPILGYATFPGDPADLDGVVISTTSFGYTGNVVAPYDNGRTSVHEVGHWLNLRHIWGDGTCATDFVADTKPAQDANYGCPNFPFNANVCTGTDANGEMYMNFMDYCDDACMVMFTKGQKVRMLATLNGPRASLASSTGCGLNVGLEPIKNSLQSINIYPNPVHTICEIQVPISKIPYLINVQSADGKKWINRTLQEIDGLVQLNLQSLPTGVYFVTIMQDGMQVIKKVIKQ
jgi:Pregnancy-associated plasma protein-A/Secretion system C-terminal sorting domain